MVEPSQTSNETRPVMQMDAVNGPLAHAVSGRFILQCRCCMSMHRVRGCVRSAQIVSRSGSAEHMEARDGCCRERDVYT